ncbi:MAG: GGDEF domain-containing protein [Halodesulfovibrio sp.]
MRFLMSGIDILRDFFGISRTRLKRLLQGCLLGIGAPLGWLCLSGLLELDAADPYYWGWLYGYMGLGTICVFAVFGYIVGRHEQRFAELSYIDSLTGLCNPRYFQHRFRQEIARSVRHRTPVCLLIADIDHFKNVNDTYGHQMGDVVLREFAEILKSCARDSDMVARVGGEEFAVLLPDTDAEGGRVVAERMRQTIQQKVIALEGSQTVQITASFGVSSRVDKSARPDAIYALADKALYAAKAGGRNMVVVMNQDPGESSVKDNSKTGGEGHAAL